MPTAVPGLRAPQALLATSACPSLFEQPNRTPAIRKSLFLPVTSGCAIMSVNSKCTDRNSAKGLHHLVRAPSDLDALEHHLTSKMSRSKEEAVLTCSLRSTTQRVR